MAIASRPPTGSRYRSSDVDDRAGDGLEAPGLRPAALIAALIAGALAWYLLVVFTRLLV